MGELKHKVLNLISGGAAAEAVPVQPEHHALEPDPARIGVMLRATRVQAGLELRDVATMLKIRHTFMEAIEAGRYHELPGTAYAVGFVRTYADYLGLDGDLAVQRFKDEVAGKVGQQSLYFPTPVPEGRVPGGAVLLVALLLAAVIYGGWYVLTASDRSLVDVVPTLPQRLVSLLGSFGPHPTAVPPPAAGSASAPEVTPPLPTPASAPATVAEAPPPMTGPLTAPAAPAATAAVLPPVTPPASTPAASAVAAPAVPAPAVAAAPAAAAPAAADADAGDEIPLVSGPSDENSGGPGPLVPMAPRVKPTPPAPADAVTPPPDTAATAAAGAVASPVVAAPAPAAPPPAAAPAPPPPPAPGRVFGAQASESRVQIKATQDTWVQIREASGEVIFSKVLHTGDAYRVPNHPGTRLRTGNAGGLQMTVDNGEPVVLGGVGEVVRDIPVDGSPVKRPTGR